MTYLIDAKKQQRMAQLSKERDALNTSIRTYKQLFDSKQQLLQMFKGKDHPNIVYTDIHVQTILYFWTSADICEFLIL